VVRAPSAVRCCGGGSDPSRSAVAVAGGGSTGYLGVTLVALDAAELRLTVFTTKATKDTKG
jgi:hypothetical protein